MTIATSGQGYRIGGGDLKLYIKVLKTIFTNEYIRFGSFYN